MRGKYGAIYVCEYAEELMIEYQLPKLLLK